MDRLKPLFTFEGRAARVTYWRRQVLISLLLAVVWVAILFAIMAGQPGAFLAVFLLPVLALSVSIALRRLHDRDKGWPWLALFWLGPFGCFVAAEMLTGYGETAAVAALVPLLAGAGLALWATVEIGFLRGTSGPNRFGPEPAAFVRRR